MGGRIALGQRRKARHLLTQALYQWLLSGTAAHDISRQFHQDHPGKVDWDYFDAVLMGITSQPEPLAAQLEPLLDRALGAVDPVERGLLYLGTFELAHRPDVPCRVVINECVELARTYGATGGHKYINGVLDKLIPVLRPTEPAAKR